MIVAWVLQVGCFCCAFEDLLLTFCYSRLNFVLVLIYCLGLLSCRLDLIGWNVLVVVRFL